MAWGRKVNVPQSHFSTWMFCSPGWEKCCYWGQREKWTSSKAVKLWVDWILMYWWYSVKYLTRYLIDMPLIDLVWGCSFLAGVSLAALLWPLNSLRVSRWSGREREKGLPGTYWLWPLRIKGAEDKQAGHMWTSLSQTLLATVKRTSEIWLQDLINTQLKGKCWG